MTKKELLLKAMRTVLQEYKEQTHENRINECSLCKRFQINDIFFDSCQKCPMYVFDKSSSVPCMQRKCYPIDCRTIYKGEKYDLRLQRVIMFYEQAIAEIESMSNSNFLKTDYQFLIKIDNSVYEEFGVRFDALKDK